MNQILISFRPKMLAVLLLVSLSVPVMGQSPAERFFKQIFAQQPDSWYPVLEENQGKYEESYGGGFKTRQSFLLVDPYASGKERYLKSIEVAELKEFLPEVDFFWGEMSCNYEFSSGKLPFIGFSDAKSAGYVFPGSYDVFNAGFLSLVGRPELPKQAQQEKYAEALAQLLGHLRTKLSNCEDEVLEFSKAKTKWTGTTLNLQMSYDLNCQVGESIEWAPKSFQMDFDFEFKGGRMTGITVLAWP